MFGSCVSCWTIVIAQITTGTRTQSNCHLLLSATHTHAAQGRNKEKLWMCSTKTDGTGIWIANKSRVKREENVYSPLNFNGMENSLFLLWLGFSPTFFLSSYSFGIFTICSAFFCLASSFCLRNLLVAPNAMEWSSISLLEFIFCKKIDEHISTIDIISKDK